MAWYKAIGDYTSALRGIGRREATITLYRQYLYTAAEHLAGSPWDVTGRDIEHLMGRPTWGPSARKSLRSALVGFYRWALRSGLIDEDPSCSIPSVRVPAGIPRPAPEPVLACALEAADTRTRLMLRLAGFAGLRAGEISRVHSRDLTGDLLIVHGKGGRQREIPIVDDGDRERISSADGWLFPSPAGGHLTPAYVSKLMRTALDGAWTGHTLRHRFGTRAYEGSRDLLAVCRLLGHANPATTLVYVRMPEDHMRDAARAAASLGALAAVPLAA